MRGGPAEALWLTLLKVVDFYEAHGRMARTIYWS